MSSASDTRQLIETAITRFQAEVPALAPLKLVVGLELRGRGDIQHYRVQLPGPAITKDVAGDAAVRLTVSRSHFNALAEKGHVKEWREAFEHGDAKATGPTEILRLITNVIDRQQERARLRRARQH